MTQVTTMADSATTTHQAARPIWLELRWHGGNRVFELDADEERAIVIGSQSTADLRIDRPGVAPVHLHFERDGSGICLFPGQRLQLNAVPISAVTRIRARAVIEFSSVALEAIVHSERPAGFEQQAECPPAGRPYDREHIGAVPDGADTTRIARPAQAPVDLNTVNLALSTVAVEPWFEPEAPAASSAQPAVERVLLTSEEPTLPGGSDAASTNLVAVSPVRVIGGSSSPPAESAQSDATALETRPLFPESLRTEPSARELRASVATKAPIVTDARTTSPSRFEAKAVAIAAAPSVPPSFGAPADTTTSASSAAISGTGGITPPKTPAVHARPQNAPPPIATRAPTRSGETTEFEVLRPAPAVVHAMTSPDTNPVVSIPLADLEKRRAMRPTRSEKRHTPEPNGVSWITKLGLQAKRRPLAVGTASLASALIFALALTGLFSVIRTRATATGRGSDRMPAPARNSAERRPTTPGSAPTSSPPSVGTENAAEAPSPLKMSARSGETGTQMTPVVRSDPVGAALSAPEIRRAVVALTGGRYAEAQAAYATVAQRVPNAPAFAAMARLLAKRTSPQCSGAVAASSCPEVKP